MADYLSDDEVFGGSTYLSDAEVFGGRKDVTAFKVSTGDQAARDQESLGILQRERENAQRLAADAQKSGNQADAVRYAGDQVALDREIAARAKAAGVTLPAPAAVVAPAPAVVVAPAPAVVVAPAPQGKAPRMTTGTAAPKSNEYVPVAATIKGKPAPFLIERRGAPVSEEKFRQLQGIYDASTPDQRIALMKRSGFEGSVFKSIDDQYRAMEKAAVATPSASMLDTRREARRKKLAVESGMDVDAADALATQQALRGTATTRLAQAKASDFDFEAKEEFARPGNEIDVRTKGGIVYRAKTTYADEVANALAASAKAVGGKVSGQLQSSAAGAWQMIGDLVSATGDLAGSKDVERFGDRLSTGNAQRQKQIQNRLAAIGENPNAALNFVESGVSGAITSIAPFLVAGPTVGVSAMVAQVVGEEYGVGKAAGLSAPAALARGSALGFSELVGEFASLPKPLIRAFRDTVAGLPAKEIVPAFARYLIKENAAEQVTNALNFGTDKWAAFGIKPNATLEDYLQTVADTFYQTTAQTLVMGAAGKVAAPVVRAINTPERQFANAFQADVDARQANAEATDLEARRAMSPNKGAFDANVASMESAARAQQDQLRAQQDQADLQQASTAGDAATAADNLSGSLDEMLEPALTGAAVPAEVLSPEPGLIGAEMTAAADRAEPGLFAAQPPVEVLGTEPGLTGVEMAAAADRAEPDLTGAEVSGEALGTEPALFAQAPVVTPVVEATGVNPDLEQKMGFDKLRLNAPRPQTIQGTPVADLSDDQLQTMAGDESIAPISRRSAAIELTARQAEPGAFTQRAAPQATGAPSTVSYAGETLDTSRTAFGLGDAQGRVSDAPVTGAGAVARTELQARLDRAAAIHGVAVPTLAAPTPENEAAVSVVADALGGVGLVDKVVAYSDPDGADGFELGGVVAVNTESQKGIAHTSFHEGFHIAERIAAADTAAGRTNTPAQQYVASIHSLFDEMSDEGKRAYISNFLNTEELDAIQDPVAREARITEMLTEPKTRSEMTADFMGNRATDKDWLASLAKADPKGFGDFVKKWISILDGMIARLRGVTARSNLESVKVDEHLKDLNRAKMVARDAMVAYRNGTLQQLAPTTTPPAMSLRQGERNAISTGNQNVPGAPATTGRVTGEDGGGPTPSYGTARAGSVSVVGRHYSTALRQSLSGAFYGQGLKGAERDRLDRSTDPRLKSRIYFYVDQGAGVRPESGVGGYAHETRLDNVYDPQTRIVKPQADFNAFESAVINAGFDGYIAPFGNNQSAVVLLGQKHKAVPVKAIGQPAAAAPVESAPPSVLKKGLMSKELSQIDTSNIPGARVRAGSLEIPAEQRDAANAELERIGSEVRFAKKEQAGPPLPENFKAKDFKVYKDVADKMGLSEAEYNATVLPLMTGQTKDRTFRAPNVGGVPAVVQWLTARRMASGVPLLDIKKPADRTRLAKLMASEGVAAIRSAGNAVEWYDETVAKTLRVMAVKYPELNTDQNARNAFLIATAISSQTMNVEDNLKYASAQYEAYRASVNAQGVGKFPEVGTGKSAPAMGKNFALANKLLAEFGPDDTRRFLQTAFTKRELEMAGFKIGGESMGEELLGSAVFGPKIGFGFYSNLAGNFEPVTMDMWFMRTLGRLTGTLPAFDPVLFPKQVAKLRAALAETGPAERGVYAAQFDPAAVKAAMETDEGAIALARQVHSLHNRQFIKERAAFDSGARVKSALVGASDTIIKSADKPTDAPGSGGERQLIRDVVRQMVDMVEEQTGKRVPPAALQALIWYPEQELYKKLGVKLRVTSQDYAGAAESLLQKEGYDGQRLRTAAESGPGRARQVASQPNAGATGQGGQPTRGTVPFKGQERENFIAARTDRFNAAEVVKQPLKKIFENLTKRGLARTRAEAAFTARPDGAQIKYVHENFLDILSELDDSGLVKINCK
jgi:hypothetical protein